MTLGELLGSLSLLLGWLPPALLALLLLAALTRAWTLLRKGRTWFAWVGGLTSIFALWVVFAGWLIYSCFAEGCEGISLATYLLAIIYSVPALLIEFLVFSGLFVGLRTLWRRRAIAKPHLEQETP
jgi:hypothetical protein